MKTLVVAGLVAAVAICGPAQAMEHKTVIEHPVGPIAADYSGATVVRMKQLGVAGGAGRASSLRCAWTVSLSVERDARVGDAWQAKRTLSRANVLKGSAPGWCSERNSGVDRMVAARRDDLRGAMMAMVEQDRTALLAEADKAHASREG